MSCAPLSQPGAHQGQGKGSSPCSRLRKGFGNAFLLWSLSPLPCFLGHGFVKKYSWEGESVCTSPAEHEEEVIPCWGFSPPPGPRAGTDGHRPTTRTDPTPRACIPGGLAGLIQIADKHGSKLLAFGQECPPLLLLLCCSPLLGKGSGIWGRKTSECSVPSCPVPVAGPGSSRRAVPVENASFGKVELCFPPNIPWLWREGRCRPRSPQPSCVRTLWRGGRAGLGVRINPRHLSGITAQELFYKSKFLIVFLKTA